MTKKQAISLAKSRFWEGMTEREIATFQLYEDKRCMPFEVFHGAVEATLGRPVFIHEFGVNVEGMKKELLGESKPPTLEDLLNMIPKEKLIIVVT